MSLLLPWKGLSYLQGMADLSIKAPSEIEGEKKNPFFLCQPIIFPRGKEKVPPSLPHLLHVAFFGTRERGRRRTLESGEECERCYLSLVA